MKKENKNANMSESYKNNYCQPEPDKSTLGAKVPASKDRDEKDTLTAKHVVEKPRDAKVVPNAAKAALDAQLGRHTETGGDLGDATPHSNSGCGESE